MAVYPVKLRWSYTYSDIHSSERSTPEILRRIGLASNIFGRLANIWTRTGLSLETKIRLYNALVISVLLYGSETWTLLKADERRLEAFHMNCQRRIDESVQCNFFIFWSRHENWMIFHWVTAIYRFLKWRPSAILELFNHHTRPPTKSLLLAVASCLSNFMSI